MRWDKTIARILLIFSVVNIVLAAPAVVRQRHIDVAEAVSGKRGEGVETTDGSGAEPVPEPVPEPVSDSNEFRLSTTKLGALEPPSGTLHKDSPPASFRDSVSSIYPTHWPFGSPDSPTYRESAHSLPPTPHHESPVSSVYPPGWPFGDPDSPTYRVSAPPKSTFFNGALKKKLMVVAALGSMVAISTGVVFAVKKGPNGARSEP